MKEPYCLTLYPKWRLVQNDSQPNITSHKAKALITFLALDGRRFHSREKLASLLWPGNVNAKARASLRQLTSVLKTGLNDEDLLAGSNNEIGLNRGRIDVRNIVELENIEAEVFDRTAEQKLVSLKHALSDFEDIGEEFRSWVIATRANLIEQASDYLQSLFLDQTLSAKFRNRLAKAALELDTYNEDAIRAVMGTYAELDNSVAALQAYGQFCAMLEEELDAEPSIKTQDLAVAIKLAEDQAPQIARPAARSQPAVTVAVLPFEGLGRDLPDHVLLGLLDHVTCRLATLRAPPVISSNSTRRFLRQTPEPKELGRVLGATYVVTGTIRSDGRDASISVQLSSSANNHIIWANTHTCAMSELYDLNIPIAHEIVQIVAPSINAAELTRTLATPTEDLEPYHLLLHAKEQVFQLSSPAFSKAAGFLKKAIDLSPYFAPAHALLAELYAISLWQGWSVAPQSDRAALEEHLQKAISLSPGDGRALAFWGHSQLMFHRKFDEAERAFGAALDLCPNDAETLIWAVPTHALGGDPDRAIELGTKAMQLSPLDPFAFRNEHFLSIAHYAAGDFEKAAQLGLSSFNHAPNYGSNIRTTVAALAASDRLEEAQPLVRKHHEVEPGFSIESFVRRLGFRGETDRRVFCDRLITAGIA